MDLKLTGATLPGQWGLWDVAIAAGQIQAVAPHLPGAAKQVLHTHGNLVIPGLVDAHIHLDKALLLDRCRAQTGGFSEALQQTLQAKQNFTIADIQQRARRVMAGAIAAGTTTMRSHVEVDPIVGLNNLEALLPLRDEFAWGLTLQLAVFAQDGITDQPGSVELLRQAMTLGGDVIGSAPYTDPDPQANIRIIFEIAAEFDRAIDFHLDFPDDDAPLLLPLVIEETQRRGWQGRVCVGHLTKLTRLPPDELEAIARQTADAGISVLALPSTDLYMMARQDTHNVRRGVAPIHQLSQWGVNVGLATNNVLNLFTPFGDGDLLKMCTLLAQVLHLGTPAQHELCLRMVTDQAAQAIGIHDVGLAPGCRADLVLLNVPSVTEAVGTAPGDRTVIKNGQVVSIRTTTQQWPLQTSSKV
ncbi:MAG: amidohydrolase family protein [Synechococcales bacterium]|nr:amidohydrolase family protein [Synechococcales bacterium]